jgi:hypothetical protein
VGENLCPWAKNKERKKKWYQSIGLGLALNRSHSFFRQKRGLYEKISIGRLQNS